MTEGSDRDGGDGPEERGKDDGPPTGTCELCGGPTVERHCKVVCLNCGYKRDCSDP